MAGSIFKRYWSVKLFSYFLLGLVVLLVVLAIFSGRLGKKFDNVNFQETKKELIYWKSIVSDKPDYPDGWVKLSILWYKLGEDKLARLAIDKAISLDPTREEFKEIQKTINSNFP